MEYGEGQQTKLDSREQIFDLEKVSAECRVGSKAGQTMMVTPNNVIFARIQITRFDQSDRKVIGEVLEESKISHPLPAGKSIKI